MEIEKIESKIIILRDQKVILDKDVAEIYVCPEPVAGELRLKE